MAGVTFLSTSSAVIHSDAGPAATAFIVSGGVAFRDFELSRFPTCAQNPRVFATSFGIPDW